MKYLLDTHVLVWAVDQPEQLSVKVRRLLSDRVSPPFGVAAISLWEIATKASGGKLVLNQPVADWMAAAIRAPFVSVLPLDERVAVESSQLPEPFHRDPADRMIVATARLHGLTLLTKDQLIRNYQPVKTLWD